MRRALVDTGPLAAYLLGRPAAVDVLNPLIARREAATSILVYGELTEYLRGRSDAAERQDQLRLVLGEIVPFIPTYRILERYADLRRALRAPHGPGLIGDIDTLIAATALERRVTLITMDRDFERVPGLDLIVLPRRA